MSENTDTMPLRKGFDDNARKFITAPVDPKFLRNNEASSFVLIVDWLETNEDTEKKVAYKKFDDGNTRILLITKSTQNGSRTSVKEPVSADDYTELIASSVLHLEKRRYEFAYTQGHTLFSMKYDEFANGKLCMLEVDAVDTEARSSFDPSTFPVKLDEVTGDTRYYGYRIAGIVKEA